MWHIETDDFRLQFLPDNGINYLNIPQSADFIVKALAFSGEFGYDFNDEEGYNDIYDDHYSIIFEVKIQEYQTFIVKAVIEKRLKAKIHFNIDGTIDLKNTFIDIYNLREWIESGGFNIGDIFVEFSHKLIDIQEKIVDLIKIEKMKMTKKYHEIEKDLTFDSDKQLALYLENLELKKEIEKLKYSKEAPFNARQKENLQTIIASLFGLILGKSSNGKPYSSFNSQQSIIDAIHANYGERRGLSKRNLEDIFAQAKRKLIELEQKDT